MRADLAGGIAHRFLRPFEVDVAAARGDDFDGGGQRAMLRLELAQCGFGVETVDVDNEDAGRCAGRDGDVVVGLLLPPSLDDVRVRGGVLEAVGRGRPLVARPAREDVKSPLPREPRLCGSRQAPPLERDVVVHVVIRRAGTFAARRGLRLLSSFCLRCADADAVDNLALQFRCGRIELQAMTGPVVGIVTGDGGDASQFVILSGSGFTAVAEIQDGFFFRIVAAAERLGRSPLDLDLERLAGEFGCFRYRDGKISCRFAMCVPLGFSLGLGRG